MLTELKEVGVQTRQRFDWIGPAARSCRNIVKCLNDDTPLVQSFRRSHVDTEVAVARIAKEVAREGLPKLVWAEIIASDVMDTGKI